ncbi:Aflatoxin B1 aldehyde reductase member 4 [Fulvia fulva]|uniref:Aflatoxin B1 aldehyde reductase member 4 n=1 Tax=Passalora fulva TaxID=5499 RepID=A0A9Q8LCE2_PASFU|nr:Aflatoxin B1 aldehyde reductase member 4 [Fulvia fulva]KAK4632699.1 Aflatoxin B1 aldehyde reductase member 4 [Fulvia fulva]UJO14634.1 Aflatoxin B1 aldehyde reductase member 4 [Fulvia fulva]
MPPHFISGDIGQHDPEAVSKIFEQHNITHIDTAARYQNGESEKIIGRSSLPKQISINTKILITEMTDPFLLPDRIEKSLMNSLKVLNLGQVDTLYCHGPDSITPIADQAKALNEHYKQGRFKHLGVSNFSTEMLQEWLDIAGEEGYVKPSWYQGQYNLLCRGHEDTLFPLLRKHGIHYAGYAPLGGGFLLGNFTEDGVQAGKRFSLQTPYVKWYDHASMHEAVKKLNGVSERAGVEMDELSLRWLVYHSALEEGDAVILGLSSKLTHFESSLKKAQGGPLESGVAAGLSALWEGVKADGMDMIDTRKW